MADEADQNKDDDDPFVIPFDVPQLPRIRNAISGGEANFSVDRRVVEDLAEATPNGLEGLQAVIEALNRFTLRAVRAVADESEVRQVLHLGTGTASAAMVDEYVLGLVPDARAVYVTDNTTALAHAHVLWRDAPEGSVGHVQSRYDDPERILRGAADTLDLDRPVAVVLPTTLNLLSDEGAGRLVGALVARLAPGSHLIVAHTSLDIPAQGTAEVMELLNSVLDQPYVSRSEAEVTRFFDGFDLLPPGVVPVEHWRCEGDPPFLPDGQLIPLFGAVGRKP